jgi:hypothetical protein
MTFSPEFTVRLNSESSAVCNARCGGGYLVLCAELHCDKVRQ